MANKVIRLSGLTDDEIKSEYRITKAQLQFATSHINKGERYCKELPKISFRDMLETKGMLTVSLETITKELETRGYDLSTI